MEPAAPPRHVRCPRCGGDSLYAPTNRWRPFCSERCKLHDLGVSLDSYQLGLSLDTGGEDIPLRLSDLEFLNANNWVLTVPNVLLDFVKSTTDAQTLAKPQLRISEGDPAVLFSSPLGNVLWGLLAVSLALPFLRRKRPA